MKIARPNANNLSLFTEYSDATVKGSNFNIAAVLRNSRPDSIANSTTCISFTTDDFMPHIIKKFVLRCF